MAAIATSPTPAPVVDDASSHLGVLICSKDRAWQLRELLASLAASQDELDPSRRARCHTTVIYTYSSDQHAESYARLKREWSDVRFVLEGEVEASTTPFIDAVLAQLSTWSREGLVQHILLGVDDMLFYRRDVPFRRLMHVMDHADSDQTLAVHLALHTQVTFCHPANRAARQPMMMVPVKEEEEHTKTETTPSASGSSHRVLRFMRLLGDCDWNYPFSLCGSIYRTSDLVALLAQCERLKGRASMSHPNSLEVVGNQVLAAGSRVKGAIADSNSTNAASASSSPLDLVPLSAQRPWSCCLAQPVMSVVTVNRVQDLYANPIYAAPAAAVAAAAPATPDTAIDNAPPTDSPSTATSDSVVAPVDLSADELLQMWLARPSLAFDRERYRAAAATFNSVHIGEFFTTDAPTTATTLASQN